MNYMKEIIKLVPQIRDELNLRSLYEFAKGAKDAEDKQFVAMSQQEEKSESDIAGIYRRYIID